MWAYSGHCERFSQLFPLLSSPPSPASTPPPPLLPPTSRPFLPSPPLPSRHHPRPPPIHYRLTTSPSSSATTTTSEGDASQDLSTLFSDESANATSGSGSRKKRSNSGVPSIRSGVQLDNISKSYKGVTVLKDVSWEVQHGEEVGLIGVNRAGNTTQLRIIPGLEDPDGEREHEDRLPQPGIRGQVLLDLQGGVPQRLPIGDGRQGLPQPGAGSAMADRDPRCRGGGPNSLVDRQESQRRSGRWGGRIFPTQLPLQLCRPCQTGIPHDIVIVTGHQCHCPSLSTAPYSPIYSMKGSTIPAHGFVAGNSRYLIILYWRTNFAHREPKIRTILRQF